MSIHPPVGMESMPTQNVWYPRSHLSQNIISSSWWGCWHTVQVLHSIHCQWYVCITHTNSSLMSRQDGWPEGIVQGHMQRSKHASTTAETHTHTHDMMQEHTHTQACTTQPCTEALTQILLTHHHKNMHLLWSTGKLALTLLQTEKLYCTNIHRHLHKTALKQLSYAYRNEFNTTNNNIFSYDQFIYWCYSMTVLLHKKQLTAVITLGTVNESLWFSLLVGLFTLLANATYSIGNDLRLQG